MFHETKPWLDALVLVALTAALIGYLMVAYPAGGAPYEDAAILMRYAEHLAGGHGVVWNVGDAPVDGATDFLFLVAVAGVRSVGASLDVAVQVLVLGSHVATIWLVYGVCRGFHGASRGVAAGSAAFVAGGPGLGYAAAYFGTPMFGWFVALSWACALAIVKWPERRGLPLGFALSALCMGLTRPEGVLLAVFMGLGVAVGTGWRRAVPTLVQSVLVFGLLGGAYFAWHWSYFGHPLPNPFYRKGGGALYGSSVFGAARGVVLLLGPLWLVYAAAFRTRATARVALVSLVPILAFTAIWVLLSDEMNYLRRFQYAVVPIAALSWPALLKGIAHEWSPSTGRLGSGPGPRVLAMGAIAAVVAWGCLGWLARKDRPFELGGTDWDGRYDVATLLSSYEGRDYTIVVTEAGLLPLYSGWRAVDAWGLNDAWVAHHGGVTPDYLDSRSPDVVQYHAGFGLDAPPERPTPWDTMVLTLDRYARDRGYVLAAVFGLVPNDVHAYWVRADLPEADAIVRGIRAVSYRWGSSGRTCTDFRERYTDLGPH